MNRHSRALAVALLAGVILTPAPALAATPSAPLTPAQLRDQLPQRRFDAIHARLAGAEAEFRQGRLPDAALVDLYWAFCERKPTREPLFDAWASQHEALEHPFLARAVFQYCLAREARGDKFISETPPARLEQMRVHLDLARHDLGIVLRRNRDSFMAHYLLMQIASYTGSSASTRHHADEATRIAPRNFIARHHYLRSLRTRWGGSIRAMNAYLDECRRAHLPAAQLAALESVIISDKAWTAQQENDLSTAIRHYQRYVALMTPTIAGLIGSSTVEPELQWAISTAKKAKDYQALDRFTTQALALLPGKQERHRYSNRAWARYQLGQKPAALADYLEAAALGDAYSQNAAGAMLFLGDGVPRDQARGLRLIEQSAASGNAHARKNLYWARRKMKSAR